MPTTVGALPFRLHLWIAARLLPVAAKRGSLEFLLKGATPHKVAPAYASLSADEILDAIKATTAHPWRMRGRRCLREGLLAFRFLSLAGYRPVLHFGIAPETVSTDRPHAHCWVDLDGATVLNPPMRPMLNLFNYDGRDAAPVPDDLTFGERNA